MTTCQEAANLLRPLKIKHLWRRVWLHCPIKLRRKPRRAHKVAISVDLIRAGFETHTHNHTTGGASENWADHAKLVTSNNKSVTDVLTPPVLTPVSSRLTSDSSLLTVISS